MRTILLSYNLSSKIHPPQKKRKKNPKTSVLFFVCLFVFVFFWKTSVLKHNKNAVLPWWLSIKNLPTVQEIHGFNPWVRKIPWRRAWQPTPVFLPGESHGQRSLVGYNPWDHKELDTMKKLSMHSTHNRNVAKLLNNSNFYRFIREAFLDMGSDTYSLKDHLTTFCGVWIREGQE